MNALGPANGGSISEGVIGQLALDAQCQNAAPLSDLVLEGVSGRPPGDAQVRSAAAPSDLSSAHSGATISGEGSGQHAVDAHTAGAAPSLATLDQWRLTGFRVGYAAAALDGIEAVRIAVNNRLTVMPAEKDPNSPSHWRADAKKNLTESLGEDDANLKKLLAEAEKQAAVRLEQAMKAHPLGPWVKATTGVGMKQAGRLIAAIGCPAIKEGQEPDPANPGETRHVVRFRTVSELWAYCGLHVIDGERARHRKGVQSNWNTEAKTRAYLIVAKCVMMNGGVNKNGDSKALSPYRVVYDDRKAYEHAQHPELSDGHCHNRALRYASKMLLRDLWRESRRLIAEAEGL